MVSCKFVINGKSYEEKESESETIYVIFFVCGQLQLMFDKCTMMITNVLWENRPSKINKLNK